MASPVGFPFGLNIDLVRAYNVPAGKTALKPLQNLLFPPSIIQAVTASVALTGSSVNLKLGRKIRQAGASWNRYLGQGTLTTIAGPFGAGNSDSYRCDGLAGYNAFNFTPPAILDVNGLYRYRFVVKPVGSVDYLSFSIYPGTPQGVTWRFSTSTVVTSVSATGCTIVNSSIAAFGDGYYELIADVKYTSAYTPTSFYFGLEASAAIDQSETAGTFTTSDGVELFEVQGYNRGTGSSVTLTKGVASATITATTAAVALTGTSVAMRVSRAIAVTTAAVTTSGTSSILRVGKRVAAATSPVTLSGSSVSLVFGRKINVGTVAATASGTSVSMRRGLQLLSSTAPATLSGTSVNLTRTFASRVITVTTSAVALTGTSVTVTYTPATLSPFSYPNFRRRRRL